MQIAYDYMIFISQKYGGVSRYFYEIIKRLSFDPLINIHLYSGFYINEYIKDLPKGNIREIGLSFPYSKYRMRAPLSAFISRINSIEADLYHTTYYYMESLNKKKFSKNICTAYDMIHEKYPNYFSNSNETISLKKNAFQYSDKIICISESTKADLIKYHDISEDKIKVIYLGSEFPTCINEPPLVEYPYILYTGQRSNYKNYLNFIKAYSMNVFLRNNLSIVTFGGGDFTKEEIELANNLNITNKIINMSGNDIILANLYANAKLFVYPSLYEGFGLPPLEAMRNNCIVAASKTSSIPEVVGNAGLYFDPLSLDDMSQTMEKAISDEIIRINLKSNSVNQVEKFSWNACYNKTLELYKTFDI